MKHKKLFRNNRLATRITLRVVFFLAITAFLLFVHNQQIVLAEENQNVFQTGETVLAIKQDGFDSQNINNFAFNGNAKRVENEVFLVQNEKDKAGSFFTTQKIHMGSGENFGFSTYFEMETSGYSASHGMGDGFTFIISKSTLVLGDDAQGLGYSGLKNSVAVIFDFYKNDGEPTSPMSIGFGLNGDIDKTTYKNCSTNYTGSNFWGIWVDYSHATNTLEVRISQNGTTRPETASNTYSVDLKAQMGSDFYTGFTSSTGGATMNTVLRKWYLQAAYSPNGIDPDGIYLKEDNPPVKPNISLTGYDKINKHWHFTPSSPTGENIQGVKFMYSIDGGDRVLYDSSALIPYGTETVTIYSLSPGGNLSIEPTIITFNNGTADLINTDYFFDGFYTSSNFITPISFDEVVSGDNTVFVKWVDATPVNQFVLGIEALPNLNLLTEGHNTTLTDLRQQYNALTPDQKRFLDQKYVEQLQLYERYLGLKIEIREYVNDLNENDYTTDNWNEIHQILEEAKDAVDDLETINDVNSFDVSEVKTDTDAVKTIAQIALEEAKENGKAQINLLKDKYNDYNYGYDNHKIIKALIAAAIAEIDDATTVTEIQQIISTLNQELEPFKVIKESDGKYDKKDETIEYESDDTDELYSIVENDEGLEDGVKVVVTRVEISTSIVTDVKQHIKTGEINDFGMNLNHEALKKQTVIGKLEINLVDLNNQILSSENLNGIYTISFLLPKELRNCESIRVVYLDQNNETVEVFDTVRDGNWITFKTEHFSGFYLLANEEEVIDLWLIIIILSILIIIEIVWIFLKKENDRRRLNSIVWPLLVIIIPNHAYLIIILLAILYVLLAGYIIYLYITTPRKSEKDETINQIDVIIQEVDFTETTEEDSNNDIDDVDEDEDDDELDFSTNVPIADVNIDLTNTPKIRYNYSMIARIHQAPKEAMERYNEIKNLILSNDDIKEAMHWKHENFVYKGRNAIQLRLQGKTIRVYFDLDYNEFKDSKYNVSYVDSKILSSTQIMMKVKGPRALKYALELIQITFEKLGNQQHEIPNLDYTLPYYDLDTLINKGLVKEVTSQR